MRTLGIVPARGGSKRIPHKNLEQVGGETLVSSTMMEAVWCRRLDALILSTDSPAIAWQGAMATYWSFNNINVGLHCRPEGTDGPMVDVLLGALAYGEEVFGQFDAVACVQPTSPFRIYQDIDAAINLLEFGRSKDERPVASVVSVNRD